MTTATGKIAPQPWMTAAETRAVIAALTAEGAEARFVGGCVRDAVARRPVGDIDMATAEPPDRVVVLLEKAGIRAIPTGIGHGTVTAVSGDARFEITTLRVDVETDGRHATVAFTDDWTADAARRDFTINTLSCTPDGDIFDPFGGLDDLGHGRVRFVGKAHERIEEDVLRLLRYFRFHGQFGRPGPDIDALAACRAMAPKVAGLSGERVRDELFRIMLLPNPADIVVLMRGEHIFEHLLPQVGDVGRLRMLSWLDTRAIRMDSVTPDPLRRLAALLDTDAAGAGAAAHRLRLSNRQTDRLHTMVAPPTTITHDLGESELRRVLYRLGGGAVTDLALLAWAGELAVDARQPVETTGAWQGLLEEAATWPVPQFPVKGGDVLALGVPEGAAVGALLDRVEAWWEAGGCRADREACLQRLDQEMEDDA